MIKVEVIKPEKSRLKMDTFYDVGTKAMEDIRQKIVKIIENKRCAQHPTEQTTITLSFDGNVVAITEGCCSEFEKQVNESIKF